MKIIVKYKLCTALSVRKFNIIIIIIPFEYYNYIDKHFCYEFIMRTVCSIGTRLYVLR